MTDDDTVQDLVSVVIPTKDRRDRLARTLVTIQAQTHPNIEIVIADDGSSDGTAELVTGLRDERFVLARSPVSEGVAAARNRGIRASSGRWIAMCDDDDLWHPEKLSCQIGALRASGTRWCFCAAVLVNDELEVISATPMPAEEAPGIVSYQKQLAWQNCIPGGGSSVVAERTLIDEVGGFDEQLSMYADWDLWLRFVQRSEPVMWREWGVLYVLHGDQMTHNRPGTLEELWAIKRKHKEFRRRMGFPGANGTDTWAIRQMARSGRRAEAVRYAISCLRRPTVRTAASVGLAALGLQRQPDPRPPPRAHDVAAEIRQLAGEVPTQT